MMVTKFIGRDGLKHDFTSNYYEIGTYGIFDGKSSQQGTFMRSESQLHLTLRKHNKWFEEESTPIPEKPKCIKSVWDNDGKTIDQYTVVFKSHEGSTDKSLFDSLGLSIYPEHPQGFSQMGSCKVGDHLGKRIKFHDLPIQVIRHIVKRIN